ncbi:phenoloxidase-activating factor 2 [Drosophila ficusphila]|uniref:phenoloxidase-activating factor 2 n=1 Tax=Drosophila ficusphila TaxID=30025 RepID=UPI0007E7314A|nr:phenoloxidase-activating factor 2 [Drosophila ficusphila]
MECVPQGLCQPSLNYQQFGFQQRECGLAEVCCSSSQIMAVGPPLNCGESNPGGLDPRFPAAMDGLSRPNEFPWIVALMERKNIFGAGTLVTENVVVTAAHLLVGRTPNSFTVAAGVWDLGQLFGDAVATRAPANIITHPEFNVTANNIALIILADSFELKPHIRTVCWPPPGAAFEGHRCTVAGWGSPNIMVPHNSQRQKKVDVPIVNSGLCKRQLVEFGLDEAFEIQPSVMCAGGERGKDACVGDGGSPLLCPVPGHPTFYQFVGIVTAGVSCGEENVPAFYTSIASMKPWIDSHLEQEINKPYKTFPIYSVDDFE